MKMKTNQQIAAEAARKICDCTDKPYSQAIGQIILAAIEEATEDISQMLADERQWGDEAREQLRAAQSSKQWTANYVAKLYAFGDGKKLFESGWQVIADAHNGIRAAQAIESNPLEGEKGSFPADNMDY